MRRRLKKDEKVGCLGRRASQKPKSHGMKMGKMFGTSRDQSKKNKTRQKRNFSNESQPAIPKSWRSKSQEKKGRPQKRKKEPGIPPKNRGTTEAWTLFVDVSRSGKTALR